MTAAPSARDASSPAVRVAGLTRSFGPVAAISHLDFEVAPGELFGIMGPDGAAKTTTLRLLAGVLRPDMGAIEVAGVDVVRDPEAAKPHLAYMAQRFGLYEDLTVRENLEFYADLYRVPSAERPERLARLYRMSRLAEFEGRLAGKLSGGMKQKLSALVRPRASPARAAARRADFRRGSALPAGAVADPARDGGGRAHRGGLHLVPG